MEDVGSKVYIKSLEKDCRDWFQKYSSLKKDNEKLVTKKSV
jgi:hypothetical protein